MIRDVKPTRMELLKARKRIELAEKGHKLLKEKRDALFNEFFRELDNTKKMRSETEAELARAFDLLALAQSQLGRVNVDAFGMASAMDYEIALEIDERNVMGAHVPMVSVGKIQRDLSQRGYSIVDSSSLVDDAASQFETALEKIVMLAEKESLLERLAFEINRTKRKVNSLEKVTIPRLEETKKYIEQRLEERERETFFTLKKVKEKKEAGQEIA